MCVYIYIYVYVAFALPKELQALRRRRAHPQVHDLGHKPSIHSSRPEDDATVCFADTRDASCQSMLHGTISDCTAYDVMCTRAIHT